MVITGFQVYEPTGPCTNFPNPCDCDEQRVSPKSSTPEGVIYYDAEAGEFKKKAAAAEGGEVEERAIVFEQIPEFLFPLFASLSGAGLKIHCEAPMQKSWGGGEGHPQDEKWWRNVLERARRTLLVMRGFKTVVEICNGIIEPR